MFNLLHVIPEVRETMYDGLELCNGCLRRRIISYDEKGERVHHLLKRNRRLHQSAELHLSREDTRHGNHVGKEKTDTPMQFCHPCELNTPQHETKKVPTHTIESVKSPHCLTLFSAIKRNALEMLTQTRKPETQIRLILLLTVAQTHNRTPCPERRSRTKQGIADGKPYHITGQSKRVPEKGNIKHAGQSPQNCAKR